MVAAGVPGGQYPRVHVCQRRSVRTLSHIVGAHPALCENWAITASLCVMSATTRRVGLVGQTQHWTALILDSERFQDVPQRASLHPECTRAPEWRGLRVVAAGVPGGQCPVSMYVSVADNA